LADETAPIGPAPDARKAYERPQLVEYGEVAIVTESGLYVDGSEDGLYYLS
jgi:hypothetical protein